MKTLIVWFISVMERQTLVVFLVECSSSLLAAENQLPCGLAAAEMQLGAPAPKAPRSGAPIAGTPVLGGALVVRGLRTEVRARPAIWVDEDAVQNKSSTGRVGRRHDDDCEGERLMAAQVQHFFLNAQGDTNVNTIDLKM